MTASGPLDAVSKAFGLLVRRINDEPFDQPSLPGSRAFTIRFIIPDSRMGSIIGKQGSKLKEIQEQSGASLRAGQEKLPGSTERVLSISGVADAVHIAVFYVGSVLAEGSERAPANLAYRPGAGAIAGGTQPGAAPFFGAPPVAGIPTPGRAAAVPVAAAQPPPGSQTQQIYIPDDLVGSIIGKGGSKINEIRQASATFIKIMEPGAGPADAPTNERLVTITGPPQNIQVAVNLLHQRIEDERRRIQAGQT